MSVMVCPDCGIKWPISDREGQIYRVRCPKCTQKAEQKKKWGRA